MKHLVMMWMLAGVVTPALADEADHLAEARHAAGSLLQTLGGELQRDVQRKGGVRREREQDEVSQLAAEQSRQRGMKISRVSLKPRNPLLGTADASERPTLQRRATHVAKGASRKRWKSAKQCRNQPAATSVTSRRSRPATLPELPWRAARHRPWHQGRIGPRPSA